MATNLGFLKGTQANFEKLTSYQAGAFYLTTDTNRLYFADSASKASYLNKYVHTVATEAALKTAITAKEVLNGDFVYVSGLNALVAIDSNAANGYVQVNAYENDDLDTKVTGNSFATAVAADKSYITVTQTLSQTTHDNVHGGDTAGPSVTGSFQIKSSDIAAITPTVGVDVGASVSNGVATIKTSGTGASGDGFTVKGSKAVTVSSNGADGFIIEADNSVSTLGTSGNTITLSESTGESSEVTIEAGTQMVTGAGSTAGKSVKVSHATITRGTDTTTGTGTVGYGDTVTMIDDITLTNGHVTKFNKKTITLPAEHVYSITKAEATNDGKLHIALKDSEGAETEFVGSQSIYFKVNGQNVYNQGSIDFYTKGEIDTKIKGINAMVYRGTLGGSTSTVTALPTTNVQIGDTYLVAAIGSYAGHVAEVGDLYIATSSDGTEESTGYIAASKIEWTYVPSGDDIDTQYTLETTSNGINLKNSVDSSSAGSATFSASNKLTMTKSGDNFAFTHDKTTVTKTAASTTTQLGDNASFSLVDAITYDDYGHITGFTTKSYKTTNATYTMNNTVSGSPAAAIVLTEAMGGAASGNVQTIEFAAGNLLKVAATNNKITFSHENVTCTKTTATKVDNATAITAVTGITVSAQGHVTGVTTTPVNFDTYSLTRTDVSVASNKATTVINLNAASGASSSVTSTVKSDSLTIAADGATGVAIDLVWGTF